MDRTDSADGKIITVPSLGYVPHPGGLGCAFFEKMWQNQDKLAQIDGLTGERETYEALLKKCIRVALTMRSKGLARDDVTTICGVSTMNICVPYISTLFLSATVSTLDPTLNVQDTVHLLKQVQPKIIFVGPEALETIEKAVGEANLTTEIVVFGETTKHTPFADFLQPQPEEDEFKPVPVRDVMDTASIMFSSGTSGLPKGICLSHRSFLVMGHATGHLIPLTRALTFASFHWISTINILVSSLLYGYSRVVVPRFDPSQFWKLLETCRPTLVFLAPILLTMLTKMGRPESVKSLAVKVVMVSGAPITERQYRNFRLMVPEAKLLFAYAQTELTGPASFFKPNAHKDMTLMEQKVTSSGPALPGFSFKIVDTETEEVLGPNQRGELRVKSATVMNGYYKMDSSDAWDSDGWLKTGDIAYYDEDRCLYVVDRIKEQLKFQSFYVPPALIEGVILQHPAVEAAVVIGIPHEEDGDHPMALVVRSLSGAQVSAEDLEKYVEERVSDKQRLRAGVKFVDKIPVTNTGKIKRKDLRDKVLRGEF